MIFEVLLEMINVLLTTTFGLLPDLPPIPGLLEQATEVLLSWLHAIGKILVFVLGKEFVLAMLPVIVLLINFKYVYQIIMWIIRKLPIGVQ